MDRLFLDTVYIQALLNRSDQYHIRARQVFPVVKQTREIWLTEAILIEVGNALSTFDRQAAVDFIDQCYSERNLRVVSVDSALMRRGLALYRSSKDKDWGLTDCISFVVMKENNISVAVTADQHFVQAGFRALLREALEGP
jgi:uncharacterized protein